MGSNFVTNNCRAAEEELMEVAEERDKMGPQIQELAWQNRNLERQVEELTKDSQQASQVGIFFFLNEECLVQWGV
jgi:hypothetical protein